ncbi:MAG: hypothetical protein AABW91_00210 [Nanoarchaeota archaeon]
MINGNSSGADRRFYEQKKLDFVERGVVFEAFPHFIAPEKHNVPESPAMFIKDLSTGRVFTGFVRALNPRDIKIDRNYKLVIRGVGHELKDHTTALFLEEIVEPGDKIHVHTTDLSKNEKLFGRFLRYNINKDGKDKYRYTVFVHASNGGTRFTPGDYIFGRAEHVCFSRNSIDLVPISAVTESRYLNFENMIIKSI